MSTDAESRDAQWVRQTLAGDADVFSMLYNQYNDDLIFYVFNRIGNWHDAQDIAQEAFTNALEHIKELREPGKFFRWLRGIATQLVIDYYRKRARAPDFTSLSDASDDEKGAEDAAVLKHQDTEQRAEREELRAELHEAIAKLPDSQQRAQLLRLEGKSYEDIAQELKASVTDVNNWLARGRAKLRVMMLEAEEQRAITFLRKGK